MADILALVRKALELREKGIPKSSSEFQKLIQRTLDKNDRKRIQTAYNTGSDPGDKSSRAAAADDQQSQDILSAIMENSGKYAPRPVAADVSDSSFDNVQPLKPLPADWHFAGSEPTTFGGLMYQYCWTGFWGAKSDKHAQVATQIRREFAAGQAAIAAADRWLKAARPLYYAAQKGPLSPEKETLIQTIGDPLAYQVRRSREGQAVHEERKEALPLHQVTLSHPVKPVADPAPLSAMPALSQTPQRQLQYQRHPNDVTGLKPQAAWTLLVDESGRSEDGAFETGSRANGILAGVLMPTANPLPKCPEMHASEEKDEAQFRAGDKLIGTMLSRPDCGVLALPIRALRSSRDWGAAVGILIDLVLRLLPLNGKTKLTVIVENKDGYELSSAFGYLRDACYYQLMLNQPARAEKIELEMKVMDKHHPFDPYPDYVANTCFAGNNVSRARLQLSGWQQTCFLEYDPRELARILDLYYSGRRIPANDWQALLVYAGKSGRNFVSGILSSLRLELQNDLPRWEEYLNHTISHLNSKDIDLRLLSAQINFLMDAQPADGEMPARLNLLWQTSMLATRNHHGELITDEEETEFLRQIRLIYPDDAPLACWTTLHLAVAMTDSFDFTRAKRLIRDFYDVRKEFELPNRKLLNAGESRFAWTPMVVPSRKYYAQMLSSYGQHEAFTGNPTSSVAYFRRAMELFAEMTDRADGEKQARQTQAYLVTALMDAPSLGTEFSRELVRYLGESPQTAAKKLAGVTGDAYPHHILLRAMADGRLPAAARRAYMAEAGSWTHRDQHPWELIEFYRGVLSTSLADKRKFMRSGYEIAMKDGGATLRMIGCCILGGLYFHDQSVEAELRELTERVITELPKLGPKRIAAMRRQLQEPIDPMVYLKKTVPFNFR